MLVGTALLIAGYWWRDKWLALAGGAIWLGVLVSGEFLYVWERPWAVGIAGLAVARRLEHIKAPDWAVFALQAPSLALVTYFALHDLSEAE